METGKNSSNCIVGVADKTSLIKNDEIVVLGLKEIRHRNSSGESSGVKSNSENYSSDNTSEKSSSGSDDQYSDNESESSKNNNENKIIVLKNLNKNKELNSEDDDDDEENENNDKAKKETRNSRKSSQESNKSLSRESSNEEIKASEENKSRRKSKNSNNSDLSSILNVAKKFELLSMGPRSNKTVACDLSQENLRTTQNKTVAKLPRSNSNSGKKSVKIKDMFGQDINNNNNFYVPCSPLSLSSSSASQDSMSIFSGSSFPPSPYSVTSPFPPTPITPIPLNQQLSFNTFNNACEANIPLDQFDEDLGSLEEIPLFNSDVFDELLQDEEAKKVCLFEVAPLNIAYTIEARDTDRNSLLHELARNKTIRHKVSEETISAIRPNLQVDEQGFSELNTTYFLEALLGRLKREERKQKKNNMIKCLVNDQNSKYDTPFFLALSENRLDVVKLFYPYASLELRKEPFMHTSLHLACMKSSYECFKFLMDEYYLKIENTAFINQKDCRGNTPLALAIFFYSDKNPSNSDKIINELIKCGRSDLKVRNNDNDSLAHLISKSQICPPRMKIDFMKLLGITYNELLYDTNNNNQTVLDCWNEAKINEQLTIKDVISMVLN